MGARKCLEKKSRAGFPLEFEVNIKRISGVLQTIDPI
jgi:hypothetical protein